MASLQQIIDGLCNTTPEIRKKCLLLLARTNNPKIIKFIEPLVKDENEEVKSLAQKILFVYSQKFNQKELIKEEDKELFIAENNPITNSSNGLTALLDSLDYKEKIITLESINENNTEIINILKTKIKDESNEYVVATYIKVISKLENKSSIEFLRPYLHQNDSRIKANALDALSINNFSYDTLIEILPLIDDNDERVKISLTQYISQIIDNIFWTELEKIFRNNNFNLFIYAIKLSLLFKPLDVIKFYDNKCDIIDIIKIPLLFEYLKGHKLILTNNLNNVINKFQDSILGDQSINLPQSCNYSFEISRTTDNIIDNQPQFLTNSPAIMNNNNDLCKTYDPEKILAKLYIKRLLSLCGFIVPMAIFVNDNLIANITAGQILELSLYPGDKNIRFSLLSSKSPNYYLSIKPKEIKYSKITIKLGGLNNELIFEEVESLEILTNNK